MWVRWVPNQQVLTAPGTTGSRNIPHHTSDGMYYVLNERHLPSAQSSHSDREERGETARGLDSEGRVKRVGGRAF